MVALNLLLVLASVYSDSESLIFANEDIPFIIHTQCSAAVWDWALFENLWKSRIFLTNAALKMGQPYKF